MVEENSTTNRKLEIKTSGELKKSQTVCTELLEKAREKESKRLEIHFTNLIQPRKKRLTT
jgi:hypothetical protein